MERPGSRLARQKKEKTIFRAGYTIFIMQSRGCYADSGLIEKEIQQAVQITLTRYAYFGFFETKP